MEEFKKVCCIRVHHVYKEAWEAAVGEEVDCEREPNNTVKKGSYHWSLL